MQKCRNKVYPKAWDEQTKAWFVYPKAWFVHLKAWDELFSGRLYFFPVASLFYLPQGYEVCLTEVAHMRPLKNKLRPQTGQTRFTDGANCSDSHVIVFPPKISQEYADD